MSNEPVGVKEKELRELADCSFCKQPVGTSGVPFFYTVTVDSYVLNGPAIQRQQGFGMMIGAPLAMIMGRDEDLAHKITGEKKTVCYSCLDKIAAIMDSHD